MADPNSHSAVDIFLKRAAQAAADAEAATLDNVRQRFRRSEAAWLALAEKAQQSEKMRADELARIRTASRLRHRPATSGAVIRNRAEANASARRNA